VRFVRHVRDVRGTRGSAEPALRQKCAARRTLIVVGRPVTPLQLVLTGVALVLDVALAIGLTVFVWPVGAVFAVFPLTIGGVLATRNRGRFRALVGLTAAVHVAVGLVLFLLGGLVLVASGTLLIAAAIAPSPEDRETRWARTRGHAVMLVVAALVLLALAPWVAGLWPE
jgi:hypothetical protein